MGQEADGWGLDLPSAWKQERRSPSSRASSATLSHTHTSLPPPLLICCFKDLPEDFRWLIDVPPPCGDTAELLTGVSETPLCYSSTYLIGCGKMISTACLIPHPCLSTCVVAPVWNNKGTVTGNKRHHFQSVSWLILLWQHVQSVKMLLWKPYASNANPGTGFHMDYYDCDKHAPQPQ